MRQGVFNPKLKLLWHTEKVTDWKRGKNISPVMVEIDLTNRCQLKCKFCTFRYLNDKFDIPRSDICKAITEMANMGVKAINFTGGGEPTLHKDFCSILGHAAEYGLDVGLFTNGYNLTDEMIEKILRCCSWVRVSIDAATDKTFFESKGVNGLQRTLDNVKKLHDKKIYFGSPTDVGVGFVITRENYKEIHQFVEAFKDLNRLKYIQFKPCIDNVFEDTKTEAKWWEEEVKPRLLQAMAKNSKVVTNYYKFNDLVSDIGREYDVCYGHQFCPCVGATGDVWVCTHLRGFPEYSFGNIKGKDFSFENIWNCRKRQDVIKSIDLSKCQKYCRNNEINKVLYMLKHTPQGVYHENFL